MYPCEAGFMKWLAFESVKWHLRVPFHKNSNALLAGLYQIIAGTFAAHFMMRSIFLVVFF